MQTREDEGKSSIKRLRLEEQSAAFLVFFAENVKG
jgi:hypothetical protein